MKLKHMGGYVSGFRDIICNRNTSDRSPEDTGWRKQWRWWGRRSELIRRKWRLQITMTRGQHPTGQNPSASSDIHWKFIVMPKPQILSIYVPIVSFDLPFFHSIIIKLKIHSIFLWFSIQLFIKIIMIWRFVQLL